LGHVNPLETRDPSVEAMGCKLDTLLEKPQFYSHEMVNIKTMKSPELMASGVGELLAGKLLFLPVKRTRKLKVTFMLT